ncbi:MAG: ADP-ribosylglycohydrolase family protein [Clostridia bacterium]|nr:ADP-ribosylglycohydrolase family protein [Clostridia bacterium]
MKKDDILQNIKAVIFGHNVADALGVPVEFEDRDILDKNPVTDMRGFGTYPYPAGTWSDDTSMTLAALDSLSDGVVDWDDIMIKFGNWLQEGEYTPTGKVFDAGRTCITSIIDYFAHNYKALECGQTNEHSNGNGSLMRILPFVLYCFYNKESNNDLELIHKASCLTHAHRRSQIACGIYAEIMWQIMDKPVKESVQTGLTKASEIYSGEDEFKNYTRIFDKDFSKTDRTLIKSSGYVVDTLEAAIWCLLTTESYSECVLKAVNLGDDTDTVAAIAGGMAGALYGYDFIPKEWLDTLARRDYIESLCEQAYLKWTE